MEYSPFVNKKGNKIGLDELQFADILEIETRGIEEGYKIEFKSQWDTNFKKKHLCKTISSFANAEGGWLFVGLEDNTGKYIGIDKQRADFSQMISQKLIEVTPRPNFECRFIHETDNKKKGVLIIQIYEGINPPYVCNGTVYTRSGSSKIPIKSDRSSIDELINKRNRHEDIFEKFCVNKFVREKEVFPHCTIYLFNPYADKGLGSYRVREQKIKKRLKEDGFKGRVIGSIGSVIRMGSDVIAANSYTSIEQYFIDGNIKIYMPLCEIRNDSNMNSWINTVRETNENINLENMTIVDGIITYLALSRFLLSAIEFIENDGYSIRDYKIVFEYKNIKNAVFYYKGNSTNENPKDKFISDVKKGNLYICEISDIKTEAVSITEDYNQANKDAYVADLLGMFYLRLFGVDEDVIVNVLNGIEDKYDETPFSSKSYRL